MVIMRHKMKTCFLRVRVASSSHRSERSFRLLTSSSNMSFYFRGRQCPNIITHGFGLNHTCGVFRSFNFSPARHLIQAYVQVERRGIAGGRARRGLNVACTWRIRDRIGHDERAGRKESVGESSESICSRRSV